MVYTIIHGKYFILGTCACMFYMHMAYHLPICIFIYMVIAMYRFGGPVLHVFFLKSIIHVDMYKLHTCTCIFLVCAHVFRLCMPRLIGSELVNCIHCMNA